MISIRQFNRNRREHQKIRELLEEEDHYLF